MWYVANRNQRRKSDPEKGEKVLRNKIQKAVEEAYRQGINEGVLPDLTLPASHQVVPPKQELHGDFASNLALITASEAKRSPRELAGCLAKILETNPLFNKIEVAGPGFLNFFVATTWCQENLRTIWEAGDSYGESKAGNGQLVQVEFVSANPTGPLHVGHGRGAAVGDSLARVLNTAGFSVEREYYINDIGNQMRTLGASVYLRYLEHFGHDVEFPKEYYQGDYIRNIAASIASGEGNKYLNIPLESCLTFFIDTAVEIIASDIRKDLEEFRVHYDNWFSEKTLHESGLVDRTISELKDKGYMFEEEGALWFRATALGDEKDRVVKRSNGVLTYFASDIAYHRHKLERGYDLLVDIWGADHHGYVARVKAAIKALGYQKDKLEVLLVQLVNLLEGGKIKAMSTRSGEFVTLREVLDDVGSDAARFIFLTRRCDSHLDFDLDLARSQNQENPVYYVQYAHARLSSVFRNAGEQEVSLAKPQDIDISLLSTPEDIKLLKQLDAFPCLVADAALALEPHRVSYYLTELAGQLHGYYTRHRFITDDPDLTQARLLLADVTKRVFRKGLGLLGVSAPEKM
ncbi:MAG: arginine--tRNA ligase [Deltaproteobacteria bacterium]|nr:arginine--tRNA ligase [Deltaproteobacteria bacterium]MBW1932063.1 arginine--tRNA ligase [Deltaproteobacteria bacterium]MBW1937598.1 arginine--tRNA ligase [Deltaproteobacteria bacterium]MBW1965033.1 arginine--tRNA ligase [Deltaproteobacteria bacterium]MBW2080545.1 arginine--tRNA ligase [Deltaproteobacteria bacterium]